MFKFSLAIIFMGFVIVLTSCSNETSKDLDETFSRQKQLNSETLLFINVAQTMSNLGAIEISTPAGFTPAFSGYNRIVHYETPTGDGFTVYVWDNPGSSGYSLNNCTKAWYDNGDCKNSGTACDVDIEDGKVVITCCDDDPVT